MRILMGALSALAGRDDSLEPGRTWSNLDRAVAVALALIPFVLISIIRWPSEPPFLVGDPFHFLLHARVLMEGTSYSDAGYIFTSLNPWQGPRVQPPGLPLLLAGVMSSTGGSHLAVQLTMFLFAVGLLGATGWYFARERGLLLGGGVAMLSGFATGLFERTTFALSDMPLAVFLWTIVLIVERRNNPGPGRLMAVTALGIVAIAFRLAAVVIVPALALYVLLSPRARARWAIPVGLWIGTGLIALLASPFSLADFGPRLNDPLIFLLETPGRLIGYRYAFFSGLLYPFPGDLANDVYHIIGSAMVLVGLLTWFRSTPRSFALWLCVTYVSMMVLLPVLGRPRYMWPVFPAFIYCMLLGLSVVVSRVASRWRRPVVAWTVAVLTIGGISATLRPAAPVGVSSIPEVSALMEFLNDAGPAPTRIASIFPRVLTWYTRIPGMPIPLSMESSDVVAELERHGISHVVVTNIDLEQLPERVIRDAIRDYGERFEPVFERGALVMYRFS